MAEDADVDIQPITRADFVPAKVFRSRSMNTPPGVQTSCPFQYKVENKVGRMGECNKNKRKTHEERWHVVTAYDGRRSGGAGSNGFEIESVVSGWVRLYRRIRRVDGHWHCLAL